MRPTPRRPPMPEATERRARGRPRAIMKESAAAVQSLDRALTLIEIIAQSDGISLSDLAQRAGLAPSSAHRLLMTLAARKFVEFIERDQHWAIGVEAFRAGVAFQKRNHIVSAGRAAMVELMHHAGETVNLGIFEDDEIVFISQVESQEPVRAFFRVGERRAAHACGIGKALLAEMPRAGVLRLFERKGLPRFTQNTIIEPEQFLAELVRIRAQGFAIDDEERNLGMRCIAASIFNEFGEAVAALSVSGPSGRLPDARVSELGPRVR